MKTFMNQFKSAIHGKLVMGFISQRKNVHVCFKNIGTCYNALWEYKL